MIGTNMKMNIEENERRIFTYPTEKIEVRIAIAIEGIDKVFLSTQVVQDIKWEKSR